VDVGYSEWGLREAAAEVGYPVNHKQFHAYCEAGLLPTPDEVSRRWSAKDLERLVQIRELGARVRSLPRRVLLLRRNFLDFPVPGEKLRAAMLAVVPIIRSPKRKMSRVHRAIVWWEQQSTPFPGSPVRPLPQRPPHPDEWELLLRTADFERFAGRIPVIYYAAGTVLPFFTSGTEHALDDIPFEEQLILWVVRELAEVRAQQRWADRLTAPPVPRLED